MHTWGLIGLGGRLALAAGLYRRGGVEVGLGRRAVGRRVVVVAGRGLGEAVLELGEQGLVLLVEQQGRLSQPLVLLHDVAVLQVQFRVQPLHLLVLVVELGGRCCQLMRSGWNGRPGALVRW
uniref:Secreted protein n=1 Tax=Arundo donax TaxID=35708 RepID=A0A0A8XTK6_ARUDO